MDERIDGNFQGGEPSTGAINPEEIAQYANPENIERQVSQAMTEGTFDFASAVEGHSYPKDTVTLVFAAGEQMQLGKLRQVPEAERDADYEQAVRALEQKIKEKTFVFHLTGIPRTRSEELREQAKHERPIEYKRIKLPNNQFQMDPVEDPLRDRLENELVWAEQIEVVVNHLGQRQVAPGRPAARAIMDAPKGAFLRFRGKLLELDLASVAYEDSVDATFPGGGSDVE